MIHGLLGTLLAFALSTEAFAVSPQFTSVDYLIENWQAEDGLPQSSVSCLCQTREGYLWIGTLRGLARFDGARFVIFDPGNSPALKSARITALHEANQGDLWIGTEGGGVARYSKGLITACNSREGLDNDHVLSLGEDSTGSIWVGTISGLNCFDGKRWTRFGGRDGLPAGAVSSVVKDVRGNLWILAANMLCSFHDGKVAPLSANFPNLPQGEFKGIFADRASDVWVYGESLLLLYKGNTLAPSRHAAGFAGDFINALCEAYNGDVWIGTRSGELERLRAGAIEPIPLGPGRSHYPVRAILEDRERNLWVGTDGGGLFRLKPKRLKTWSAPDKSSEPVLSIAGGDAGALFLSANCGGLSRWKDGVFEPLPTAGSSWETKICTGPLLRAGDGSLWIGTFGNGLFRLQHDKMEHFGREQGLLDGTVLALCEAGHTAVWVGTERGLYKMERGQLSQCRLEGPGPDFPTEMITAIVEDAQGTVWIGSNGNGLYRLAQGKVSRFSARDGVGSDFIQTLLLDQQQKLWVGTAGGLAWFENGQFNHINASGGLADNVVSQILDDDFGNLWLGGNRGISRLAKREVRDFAEGKTTRVHPVAYDRSDGMESSECSGGVFPNAFKRDGKLWFGTVRGPVRIYPLTMGWLTPGIQGDCVTFQNPKLTLGPAPRELDLADVAGGGNGFGTGAATGINAESGRFENKDPGIRKDLIQSQASRFHRVPHSLIDGVFIPYPDSDGQVTITSSGLTAASPETTGKAVGLISRALPQSNDPCEGIPAHSRGPDGGSIIVMKGNQGITFDLQAIRSETGRYIKRFQSTVANLGVGPATFYVYVDGVLVMNQTGIYLDPEHPDENRYPIDILIPGSARFLTLMTTDDKDNAAKQNVLPPPVVIEEVVVDGKITALAGETNVPLKVRPGVEQIELRYAALSLAAPEKVQFRYRLESYDSGWIDGGGNRSVRYTKLPPGDYRFRVIACNNDGAWNLAGATLALSIQPLFWQTTWFRFIGILGAGSGIGAMIRAREKKKAGRALEKLTQQHAIEKERTRIARDMHDELGGKLAKISYLSELAKSSAMEPELMGGRIETIAETSRSVLQTLDEIVWAVNPRNDTVEHLAAYMAEYTRQFFQMTPIECEVSLPINLPPYSLTAEQRHNLFLAVQEALNNVLKHSGARHLRLRVTAPCSMLEILIKDDGCGFRSNETTERGPLQGGNGLPNIRRRLNEIGADLALESSPEKGTQVKIRLQMNEGCI